MNTAPLTVHREYSFTQPKFSLFYSKKAYIKLRFRTWTICLPLSIVAAMTVPKVSDTRYLHTRFRFTDELGTPANDWRRRPACAGSVLCVPREKSAPTLWSGLPLRIVASPPCSRRRSLLSVLSTARRFTIA